MFERAICRWAAAFAVVLSATIGTEAVAQKITVVNVIPFSLSNESNQDSEPSIAVNPTNPSTAVITTFSRVNGASPGLNAWGTDTDNVAPTWVTTNSGATWTQQANVPQPAANVIGPLDQTLAYNTNGAQVYGAFLGGTTPTLDEGTSAFIRSHD